MKVVINLHQPAQRHRSPSYFRRQERRRAAREIEHFLQYGFIRDPNVRNYGQELRICIGDELRKCGLSWEVRQEEFKLMKKN